MAQVTPWLTRMLMRVFRRRLNRDVLSRLMNRCYERGVINSHQLHAIHHHMDPTQSGYIGKL
jgi:sterol desaturase/sphingolipid hydroxylase (fatty acid hydroxylase superfamily)